MAGPEGARTPGPGAAQPAIEDARGGADDKTYRRAQRDAEPALDQPSKECLLDRAVENVKAGLERRVVASSRNAQSAAPSGQPQLHERRRHEQPRRGHSSEDELCTEPAGREAKP